MAAPPTTGPLDLTQKDQDTQTLSLVVEVYVQQVVFQPVFPTIDITKDGKTVDESAIPNQHLTAAKTTAQKWTSDVKPSLIQTNSDLLAYATKYKSLFAPLQSTTNNWPAQKDQFIQGLNSLIQSVTVYQQNSSAAQQKLQDWNKLVGTNVSDFNTDNQKIINDQGGIKSQIEEKKKAIESMQSQMQADLEQMAEGTREKIAGAVCIAVGWIIPGAMIAGIVTEVVGNVKYDAASKDYNNKVPQLQQLNTDLKTLNTTLSNMQIMSSNLTGLSQSGAKAYQAASAMNGQWQTLIANMNSLLTSLQSAEQDAQTATWGAIISADLETSMQLWQIMLSAATAIQDQLTHPKIVGDPSKSYADVAASVKP